MATLEEYKIRLAAVIEAYKILFGGKPKWDAEEKIINTLKDDFKKLNLNKFFDFSANDAEKATTEELKKRLENWVAAAGELEKKFPKKKQIIDSEVNSFNAYVLRINKAQEIGADPAIQKSVAEKIDKNYQQAFGNALAKLNNKQSDPTINKFMTNMTDLLKTGQVAVEGQDLGKTTAGKIMVKDGVFTVVINSSPTALCNQSFVDIISAEAKAEWKKLQEKQDNEDEMTTGEQKKLLWYKKSEEASKQDKERTILHETRHLLQAKEGKMLQTNNKGSSILTYDITDEVEAFQTEASVFGFVKIGGEILKKEEITIANVSLDSYYAKLPQKPLSISLKIVELLPFENLNAENAKFTTIEDLKNYVVAKTGIKLTELDKITAASTLQELLELKCADEKTVWEHLDIAKTW